MFGDWLETTTGSKLFDYYDRNLNASWRTDAGAENAMRNHWEAAGSPGTFEAWADSQEAALRDPRINNALTQSYYMFEQSGMYSAEELKDVKDFIRAFASGQMQFEAVDEWGVYDSSGNLIKRFGSQSAADTWLDDNKEKYPDGATKTTGGTWYNARNAETGEVFEGGGGGVDPADEGVEIDAEMYKTLGGLSYGSGEASGKFANGSIFTTNGAMSVTNLDYTLPKGSYTVEVDDDGNVWYKNDDDKYYLAETTDKSITSEILKDSDLIRKISGGLDSKKIPSINVETPTDPPVEVEGTGVVLGNTIQGLKTLPDSIDANSNITLNLNGELIGQANSDASNPPISIDPEIESLSGSFYVSEVKNIGTNTYGQDVYNVYMINNDTGEKIIATKTMGGDPILNQLVSYDKVDNFTEEPTIYNRYSWGVPYGDEGEGFGFNVTEADDYMGLPLGEYTVKYDNYGNTWFLSSKGKYYFGGEGALSTAGIDLGETRGVALDSMDVNKLKGSA